MCEALLADVKNYLNITWDDQATDLKISSLIKKRDRLSQLEAWGTRRLHRGGPAPDASF